MRVIFAFALLLISCAASAIDLREYFPASSTVILNSASGTANAKYTFQASPSGYLNLYQTYHNLNKAGYHYLWRKEYWQSGAWVKAVDQILFMGDDQSVTETGGWKPVDGGNIVVGYKYASGANGGLLWSPAGGLGATPAIAELEVWQQATPGAAYSHFGQLAYSKSGLLESLASYAPPYGRNSAGQWCAGCSRSYSDVAHLVLYHGTKTSTSSAIRCGATSPIAADGAYYQSFGVYNSYAVELWIAKGIGVIQERTPFIEDGSFWGIANCDGWIFDGGTTWTKYIDRQ